MGTSIVFPGIIICFDLREIREILSPCLSLCFGFTGRVASKAVAGTILLSLSRDIVLLFKSCFIPFCFIKSVPPMTGECSLLQTSA